MSGAVQLSMFSEAEAVDTLDARLWRGSFPLALLLADGAAAYIAEARCRASGEG